MQLSLDKLFKLHGLSLSRQPKDDVTLPKLVEAILSKQSGWREWCKKLYIEGRAKEEIIQIQNSDNTEIYFNFGNWKSPGELNNLSFDTVGIPEEILVVLHEGKMISPEGKLSIKHLKELGIFPKPSKKEKTSEEICKWLEGIWLEDYVLQQLKNIQSDCLLDEVGMSFKFPEKSGITFFEFDVACLRGYQLFAISCTTDDTSHLCKSKLFEAYRRAKQMGGDEARVALVCYSDKADKIKQSFMSYIDDPKVEVFGSKDINNLSEHLKNWIQGVDK
ncbi:MAG: DUF1887 family protein [Scytonematopsis contorta HA4267-MV1]|nr:DUF1887 family protein [Scytonematopsis contorta HA4267-MV1]